MSMENFKINKVIAKITEQQQGKEGTAVFGCGEQLKDICRECEANAELVLQDLENPDMSITKCEAQIKAIADAKHKKHGGGSACVVPDEADEIIRKFYGLGAKVEAPASPGIISLEDFM